jgi:hypothetical protein
MKKYDIIIALLFGFTLLSCNKEITRPEQENNVPQPVVEETPEQAQPVFSTQSILDGNRQIISAIELYRKYEGAPVYYVHKLNLDITEGEAWFAAFGDIEYGDYSGYTKIYIIKENNIIKEYDSIIRIFDEKKYISFNILEGIPGEQIGHSTAAIYDYNQDGFDDILSFSFGGMAGNRFEIIGYDREKDEIISYCDISFVVEDSEKGPPPVKFFTYEEYYGFSIHTDPDFETWDYLRIFWYYHPESKSFNPMTYAPAGSTEESN